MTTSAQRAAAVKMLPGTGECNVYFRTKCLQKYNYNIQKCISTFDQTGTVHKEKKAHKKSKIKIIKQIDKHNT